MKNKKLTRILTMAAILVLMVVMMAMPAFAASGDVSGAIEGTWTAAKGQVQTIVNNVVFPVIDMILAILLFVKIATAYMECKSKGDVISVKFFAVLHVLIDVFSNIAWEKKDYIGK